MFTAFDMLEMVTNTGGEVLTARDGRMLQGNRSQCPVCYQDNILAVNATRIGDAAVMTRCRPVAIVFHARCQVRWRRVCTEEGRETTCPICRTVL